MLRLLPAGAVAGWGLHPPERAALARRTREPAVAHCGRGRKMRYLLLLMMSNRRG